MKGNTSEKIYLLETKVNDLEKKLFFQKGLERALREVVDFQWLKIKAELEYHSAKLTYTGKNQNFYEEHRRRIKLLQAERKTTTTKE